MVHKFNAKKKHKLDNEQRRKILPPEQTLINLDLQEGDIMADFLNTCSNFNLVS